MNVNEELIQMVLSQSPEYVTELQVRIALSECNNDVVDAVAKLWNVAKKEPKKVERTILDDVRESADYLDNELRKQLNLKRQQSQQARMEQKST